MWNLREGGKVWEGDAGVEGVEVTVREGELETTSTDMVSRTRVKLVRHQPKHKENHVKRRHQNKMKG